ncbi:hypothetical protein [Burkholderia cepacia]|uniref:hypothetical protein n=1 Tax=Burkholderia cepacia TaxID=292 RepID=UPI000F58AC35|nr:hypothetical protein [Burkholderia cepacia]
MERIWRVGKGRFFISSVLVFAIIAFSGIVSAKPVTQGRVILSTTNCTWWDTGWAFTVTVTVSFLQGFGSNGNDSDFKSRGIAVYTYDSQGKPKLNSAAVKSMKMGDVSYAAKYDGDKFVMFSGFDPSTGATAKTWNTKAEFDAKLEIALDQTKLGDWKAIAIKPANVTNSYTDIVQQGSAVYFYPGVPSRCFNLTDPEKPTAPPVSIGMTAPDWNLGELQPGNDVSKTFTNVADQLCFTYTGTEVRDKKFVINASNANGVASNRYRLKNLKDATQLVPYSLTLNSGTSTVLLPNASNADVSFDSSGKTCFVPTFKATVDSSVKDGDYSDVLTFTVVTKS